MSCSTLIRQHDPGGYVRLLLNRPARRNALDERTVQALMDALDAAPEAVVLLGSTDPTIFCAGADLDVSDSERTRLSDLLYQCYERMITRAGPVIAVVEGAAVGGGAQLATAADLRVAGRGARFRWLGPGHGLAVGAWVLPSLVGRATALELALTGRWVDGTEACRIGLASTVDKEPWTMAERMAMQLLSLDSAAVARVKAIVSSDGLIERLAAERQGNRASWSGTVTGVNRGDQAQSTGKAGR